MQMPVRPMMALTGVLNLPSLPLPETEIDLSLLPVRAGGAVFFDTEEEGPAYYKITYQTKTTEEVTQ